MKKSYYKISYFLMIFVGISIIIPTNAQAEVIVGYWHNCYRVKYNGTDEWFGDWFDRQVGQLLQENPKYDKQTQFVTVFVSGERYKSCAARAQHHVGVIREAVDENRRNVGNKDYAPQNIAELIKYAKREMY